MQPELSNKEYLGNFKPLIDELFVRCQENAPNFEVTSEAFAKSVGDTLIRFRDAASDTPPTDDDGRAVLEKLHVDDLFLALACASGNERAWWEFDQQYRSYIESIAKYLSKTDVDAYDVTDIVYTELYGTRVVDGARVSKFATYSGRGSLRGWLRTVIWHSLVDLHRTSHDEVSLDEMTENVGEGAAQANLLIDTGDGETAMLQQIERNRFRQATITALDAAFNSLESHEKLLLLYYHVERLTLNEITRLVEPADSPLRNWFQQRTGKRGATSTTRTHESTVMRWLNKCYGKISQRFRLELQSDKGFTPREIESCIELAMEELSETSVFKNLSA